MVAFAGVTVTSLPFLKRTRAILAQRRIGLLGVMVLTAQASPF